MNPEQLQELNKFKESWGTLEQVEKMTLEQYTNTTSDSFMYMIEWGTKSLGGISGSYAIKAGIYAKLSKEIIEIDEKRYKQDKEYLWYRSLGETHEEAFKEVKLRIINIIKAVQNETPEEIENISTLWRGYKYKIAFLYQTIFNKKSIKILPIFNKDHLSKFLGITDKNQSIFELYQTAIKRHDIKTLNDAFSLMYNIYDKTSYISENDIDKEESISIIKDSSLEEKGNIAKVFIDEQQKSIENIKWPSRICSITLLFLGIYFLLHEYLHSKIPFEITNMLWFWILWMPLTLLLWCIKDILLLSIKKFDDFLKSK